MANENPLVSIVIPTYNRAHLIGETIQSVLDQTYTNWELIIVDDGSTDETQNIVGQYRNPGIKYYCVEHSGSFGVVRNLGLKHSRGDFIAFLDSDDLWKPDKLEKQLDLFDRSSVSMFTFTHVTLIGKYAHHVPDYPSITGEKLFDRFLEEGHFTFYPSSLMLRREALAVGLMDENLKTGADTEFLFRLGIRFKGSFMAENLTLIRKHDQNTSSRELLFGYADTISIMRSLYQNGQLKRKVFVAFVSKLYYKMGLVLKNNSQFGPSLKWFLCYFRLKPLHWKGWVRVLHVSLQYLAVKLKAS